MIEAFGITDLKGRKLKLLTPSGSVIDPEHFKEIVTQFGLTGNWVLNMVFVDKKEPTSTVALVCVTFDIHLRVFLQI